MRAVVQRVTEAEVCISGKITGRIGPGFLVLVAGATDDTDADAVWLADRIWGMRILSDADGKMNLSLADAGLSEILVVSQFTLYGDARKSRRPSFVGSAPYDRGLELYNQFTAALRACGATLAEGVFGANMQVSLVNDGPVTLILDSRA
ncbi:MAG: D-tyrosyl-tRNA(Tyr) deacylase [Chthonomonas sp.]|nr:D-tyrosyl-tRNA(Tyr) deacylase [Chthonomonas sp.]